MRDVVIVDDEHLERWALRRIVGEVSGVRVAGEGRCGREAVDLCARIRPALLFLNGGMGGMSGFDAAKRIAGIAPETAIAMTTAYDRLAPKRDLKSMNVVEYLLKPIRPEKIVAVVRAYCKGERAAEARHMDAPRRHDAFPDRIPSKEMTRALLHIDHHYAGDVTLETVSSLVSLSPYYFSRLFKREVGVNFSEYLLRRRLDCAKRLLRETDKSVLEVSAAAGFQEQSYFCRVFKKRCGMTPGAYRRGGDGAADGEETEFFRD